jgi:hypothetical protein
MIVLWLRHKFPPFLLHSCRHLRGGGLYGHRRGHRRQSVLLTIQGKRLQPEECQDMFESPLCFLRYHWRGYRHWWKDGRLRGASRELEREDRFDGGHTVASRIESDIPGERRRRRRRVHPSRIETRELWRLACLPSRRAVGARAVLDT